MLGVGLLLIGGQFTAFTYLTPYLQQVTGISGGAVSVFLLVYGVASAVGTFGGGRLADRAATTTLVAANALLILALGAVYLAGAGAFRRAGRNDHRRGCAAGDVGHPAAAAASEAGRSGGSRTDRGVPRRVPGSGGQGRRKRAR
jgi:MFS family permease